MVQRDLSLLGSMAGVVKDLRVSHFVGQLHMSRILVLKGKAGSLTCPYGGYLGVSEEVLHGWGSLMAYLIIVSQGLSDNCVPHLTMCLFNLAVYEMDASEIKN